MVQENKIETRSYLLFFNALSWIKKKIQLGTKIRISY